MAHPVSGVSSAQYSVQASRDVQPAKPAAAKNAPPADSVSISSAGKAAQAAAAAKSSGDADHDGDSK